MKRFLLLILLFAVGCMPVVSVVPTPTGSPTAFPIDPTLVADPVGRIEWTFLLLGGDERAGDENRQNTHTDAIMLVHVREFIANEDSDVLASFIGVTFMAIPRDLFIEGHDIANSIYRREGAEGMASVFAETFGLPIDAVLYLNMDNFESFIDDIGGVNVTIPFKIKDRCSDREGNDKLYQFAAGQRENFFGHDLLCIARMRKRYDDGFFTRQQIHPAIALGIYERLVEQMIYDPQALAEAAITNPFVEFWPFTEAPHLAMLGIRSTFMPVRTRTVNLAPPDVVSDQLIGLLADGSTGPYEIHRAATNLRSWAIMAIDSCSWDTVSCQ